MRPMFQSTSVFTIVMLCFLLVIYRHEMMITQWHTSTFVDTLIGFCRPLDIYSHSCYSWGPPYILIAGGHQFWSWLFLPVCDRISGYQITKGWLGQRSAIIQCRICHNDLFREFLWCSWAAWNRFTRQSIYQQFSYRQENRTSDSIMGLRDERCLMVVENHLIKPIRSG